MLKTNYWPSILSRRNIGRDTSDIEAQFLVVGETVKSYPYKVNWVEWNIQQQHFPKSYSLFKNTLDINDGLRGRVLSFTAKLSVLKLCGTGFL